MATYVLLAKYTQEGIAGFKGVEERLAASMASLEKMGIEYKGMWLTMGQYDLVALFDAPDDETMATWLLALGQRNIVTTETMRAFTEEEAIALAKRLP